MAVDPDTTTTTVATGSGLAALAGLIWKKFSNDSRHAARLANEAKVSAEEAHANIELLRAELKLQVTQLSAQVAAVKEQGTRNEAGIGGIQASITIMNSAWSADRTATAGILGRIEGRLERRQPTPSAE